MVPGSSVATVGALASAATPAGEMAARWSADVAPSSAASSAPPAARQLVGVQLERQAPRPAPPSEWSGSPPP